MLHQDYSHLLNPPFVFPLSLPTLYTHSFGLPAENLLFFHRTWSTSHCPSRPEDAICTQQAACYKNGWHGMKRKARSRGNWFTDRTIWVNLLSELNIPDRVGMHWVTDPRRASERRGHHGGVRFEGFNSVKVSTVACWSLWLEDTVMFPERQYKIKIVSHTNVILFSVYIHSLPIRN